MCKDAVQLDRWGDFVTSERVVEEVGGTRHICVRCSYDLDADVFGAALLWISMIGETVQHKTLIWTSFHCKKAEIEMFLCGFRELSTKLYMLRIRVATFFNWPTLMFMNTSEKSNETHPTMNIASHLHEKGEPSKIDQIWTRSNVPFPWIHRQLTLFWHPLPGLSQFRIPPNLDLLE